MAEMCHFKVPYISLLGEIPPEEWSCLLDRSPDLGRSKGDYTYHSRSENWQSKINFMRANDEKRWSSIRKEGHPPKKLGEFSKLQ